MPTLDGRFVLFGCAVAATPEMGTQGLADGHALVDALAAYSLGRDYLNFAEEPVDVRRTFPDSTWRRLVGVRTAVDPGGRLLANHVVPRLFEDGVSTTAGEQGHSM